MSSPVSPVDDRFLSKHRLEALADGVFAVVLTLLVLEIKPELAPHADDEAVRHTLRALALPVLAYALAFGIAGIFWHLHHRKFTLLRHTNPGHTGLTLVFLFPVTLLPISVSLFLHAKASGLAQAVYFGNFTFIAATLLASWLYAHRAGLLDPGLKPEISRDLTQRIAIMTIIGVIAAIASFLHMSYLILFVVPVIIYVRRRLDAAKP